MDKLGTYDVIVIGAGHAGIEAAHAAAKVGAKTAVFTLSLDFIGNMPCSTAARAPPCTACACRPTASGTTSG